MTIKDFFKQFELFADAPNAVAKMRKLLTNLAVRGILVDQCPDDEPANKSVEQVKLEAKNAIREGIIRRHGLEDIPDHSERSELPRGWRWTCLVEITRPVPYAIKRGPFGSAIRKDMFVPAGFKVYEQQHAISGDFTKGRYYIRKEQFEELVPFELHPGEVLVSCSGTVGKVAIVPSQIERGIINQALLKLSLHQSALLNEYFLLLFPAFLMETDTLANLSGTAQKNIPGVEVLKALPFPLPPLAEQKRIVAKVDELMALCDRLEAQQQERETRHAALARASLARFAEAPTPTNLNLIFHKSFHVAPEDLRISILTLAVQGRLLKDGAKGESATEILTKAGVLIEVDDALPRLPNHWQWAKLGNLATRMDSGWSPACLTEAASPDEWGVLKTTAVQPLQYQEHQNKGLPRSLAPRPDAEVIDGDILFTRAGPMNRVGIACVARPSRKKLMISDKIIRIHTIPEVDSDYVALSLSAGYPKELVEGLKSGMAASQVNISQPKLKTVPIPIPPLAEQRRIVAKVDQLMGLVDALEKQLAEARQKAERLMEAVVMELTGKG